ncbi:MAG: D-alanyl-D-alanine carboxypeptidase/D-alanyl-D-alanine-endopeptidase [Bacteroides sp.]|nr:D-alanyl-D-alanine carboxypeptidase/D-alanyl-D-alanine-endopeptidase [Bacteroides sp.]
MIHNKFIWTIILILTLSFQASPKVFDRYDSIVSGINADKIGVYIEDLRTGDVVLDVNGEEPMIPASITKVLTAATAFQKVNIDQRYMTSVIAYGSVSKDSTLKGNIVVKATGDPTIESSHFSAYKGVADSIAKVIWAMGIRKIQGSILIDRPEWLEQPVPSGWENDDVNWPYGTGHHALNYADNKFSLTYSRDGSYSFAPAAPSVEARASKSRGGVWRDRDSKIYYVNHKGSSPLKIALANPDPASSFVHAITHALSRHGITIENQNLKREGRGSVVYNHKSPTIYEIIKSMILRSDNQMAEAILRYSFPNASREKATESELKMWRDKGLELSDCYIEDGSGLSRRNKITPYAMADLLVWMVDKDKNFVRFLNAMPRAGRSGTLKSFLKSTPLENRLWAKTGSMSGVQCYAGYIVDQVGVPTHVVVIMVNGFKGDRSALKSILEKMLVEKINIGN